MPSGFARTLLLLSMVFGLAKPSCHLPPWGENSPEFISIVVHHDDCCHLNGPRSCLEYHDPSLPTVKQMSSGSVPIKIGNSPLVRYVRSLIVLTKWLGCARRVVLKRNQGFKYSLIACRTRKAYSLNPTLVIEEVSLL